MRKLITFFLATCLLASTASADPFTRSTRFPNGIWVGPTSGTTATNADGAGDMYINGDLEINGSVYESTQIIPWVTIDNAFIDGTGPITGSTTPNWTTFGNVSGITFDDSTEVTKVQFTGRYPSTCGGGLVVSALIGSDTAAAAGLMSLDWQIWINGNGTAYDAAAIAQTAVDSTNASLDTSPELFTLTLDATGQAALSGGESLTIDLFNASTAPTQDLVIMDVSATCSN